MGNLSEFNSGKISGLLSSYVAMDTDLNTLLNMVCISVFNAVGASTAG
jgi:hypothetical protein